MTLEINGLTVDCVIGERPEERLATQPLRVDASLEIGDGVASSDELADTVDYAELARRIRETLAAAGPKMIERAARLALDEVLRDGRVLRATVKVTKYGAIPQLESASATCSGGR